jgi:muconolactone delta-isomerase
MKFMVSASLRAQDQKEMLALVPQEQAHIQVLQEQGTIEVHYLGADRLHVWVVMRGESQDQVQKVLESFPLYPYVKELAIAPLV